MVLRAQMRKSLSSPSPEALLSQLSCYNRAETHSVDGVDCSEASRALGTSLKAGGVVLLPLCRDGTEADPPSCRQTRTV